jgi:hypothetical protein
MTPLFDMSKLRAAVPQHVVERALALIEPKPDQREACAEEVCTHVALLHMVVTDLANAPQPPAMKAVVHDKIEPVLRKLQAALAKHPTHSHAFAVDLLFLAQLDRLIDAAKFVPQALVAPKPSRYKWDDAKGVAAKYADTLLRRFSAQRPTKYPGGAFYALASVLYEGATGERDVDLEKYCRQLGRIRGGHVLRGLTFKAPTGGEQDA